MTATIFSKIRKPQEPLRAMLPTAVSTNERWGDVYDFRLTDAESIAVERSIIFRRREFATGRHCAHTALLHMGMNVASIGVNPDRTPIWPDGIVGSITHTHGYTAAAVAKSDEWLNIGVDAEVEGAVHKEFWPEICRPEELLWLDKQAAQLQPTMATLLFSAKESFYKCHYPLSKRWLDFNAVSVTIHGETFKARLQQPTDIHGFPNPVVGNFMQCGGLIITAIAVPRERTNHSTAGADTERLQRQAFAKW